VNAILKKTDETNRKKLGNSMNIQGDKRLRRVVHREYTDVQGNLHTEYKDPQGNLQREYKDRQGNLHTEYTDVQGNVHTEYTDPQGNLHRQYKDPEGNLHGEYTDAQGNFHTEYTDAQGNLHRQYKDPQGNIHAEDNGHNVLVKSASDNPSRTDGYLAEERLQNARLARNDNNRVQGILIAVIVACVAGLTAGAIYFMTKQNNPEPASVMNLPIRASTQSPSPAPQQVRIIEQPVVTIVRVPQTQAPAATKTIVIQQPATANPPAQPKTPVQSSAGNGTSPTLARSDSDLKAEILKQFQAKLPEHQLIVEVKGAVVTVSGTVGTPEELQRIQPLLRSIWGIDKVNMKATVEPQM